MAVLGFTRMTVEGRQDLKGVAVLIKMGAKLLDDIIDEIKRELAGKADQSALASKADQSALSSKANASTVAAKCDLSVIAPAFSDKSTYNEGELVIQGGRLLECAKAVETAGEFNASDWTERTIAELVMDLRQAAGS